MVIFLWKISQGPVKGYQVTFTTMGSRGRMIIPNTVVNSSPAVVRNARESSLGVKGARIFNLLPAGLRNLDTDNVDIFKDNLDAFLMPDQPTIGDRSRAAATNSLLDQIPMMTAVNR